MFYASRLRSWKFFPQGFENRANTAADIQNVGDRDLQVLEITCDESGLAARNRRRKNSRLRVTIVTIVISLIEGVAHADK